LGLFYYGATHKFTKCTDGLSKTMMIGEVIEGHITESSNIWSRAIRAIDCQRYTNNPLNTATGQPVLYSSQYGFKVNGTFASKHLGGCQFVFADGHATFLRETMDYKLYAALSTRAGNESVANDF
jgi:prepilin-type processing-associated H-X9-DG protein